MTLGPFPALTATAAKDLLTKHKAEVAKGGDPLGTKQAHREGITLDKLVSEYYNRHLKKTKTGRERHRLLEKEVVSVLGAKTKSVDVERREVIRLFERKSNKTPSAANHVLAAVHSMYNWATEKEVIDYRHANPALGIEKNKEKSRQRYLSNDEIADFWKKLPDAWWIGNSIADALKLILATGKRSGEVCGMKWSGIRKDKESHWWWIIPGKETKNGQEDKVTLNSIALEIIEKRTKKKSPGDEFVFPSDQATHLESHSLGAAIRRSTGQQKRPRTGEYKNDFGAWRTVASHLQILKVPLPVTKRVLNHVSGSAEGATAVYTRYEYDDEAREAMARWSTRLRKIITGEKQQVVAICG